MCIHRLVKFTPCKIGYKVMKRRKDGKLVGDIFGSGLPRPIGMWLNEKDFRSTDCQFQEFLSAGDITCKGKYPIGWHIFHTRKTAVAWMSPERIVWPDVCVRVLVRQPKATGYQVGEHKVTVAKQIQIIDTMEVCK